MPTLAEYKKHVDYYGAECVVDRARRDLTESEVEKLAAYIKIKARDTRVKPCRRRREHA